MIGILGGTFDPVHVGHLHIANEIVSRLALEQLQLMPCAVPVHRIAPGVSMGHRCQMIRLAIDDHPALALSTLEVDRDGPSYSVDSLREFHRLYDATPVLVLGLDAYNSFHRWKSPDEILQLAHLVICLRPGIVDQQEKFRQHLIAGPEGFEQSTAGAILMLEVDAPKCSSSEVRMALAAGNMPTALLPPSVADYINEHNLYRKTVD